MFIRSATAVRPLTGRDATPDAAEPSAGMLVVIFWLAFAAAAIAAQIAMPEPFARTDPDSVMRLVEVRDLLGGQGWFDMVQHRMDPPQGTLMHWSRLVDAPLAAIILAGDALAGAGESIALTIWPLLMLLGYLAGCVHAATALGGRRAALPALLVAFGAYQPLLAFQPGVIDHHNVQQALLLLVVALALRMDTGARFAAAAGAGCALMLAIGLETLPYVAVLTAVVAVRWALHPQAGRATAGFAAAFALAAPALMLATGAPALRTACETLSWTYCAPALVGGLGLAALAASGACPGGSTGRLAALACLALAAGAVFLAIAPECRFGPYGFLGDELNRVFLGQVAEAKPISAIFRHDPAEAMAAVLAPLVAVTIAGWHACRGRGAGFGWTLLAALAGAALLLSLYQMRTIPYAVALAVPVLGAWISGLSARRDPGPGRLRRALPAAAAMLLVLPLAQLAIGAGIVAAVHAAGDGERSGDPRVAAGGDLTVSQRECADPASAARLRSVPAGLVLAPLFYGPQVLRQSPHAVVAGPYHRAERAIIDTLAATAAAPQEALAMMRRRSVDYLAVCATSQENVDNAREAPHGLVARVLAGDRIPGLEPVQATETTPGTTPETTSLRLFRVVRDPVLGWALRTRVVP